MQKIIPHLWFDKEADEASKFYLSLFEGSSLKDKTILNNTPSGSVDMITIELAGQEFILLSAGPLFKFTPAVSFLIACSSSEEVEGLWGKLIEKGAALMPLDKYPFSQKYGWVIDKYGLSWQIMQMGDMEIKQKITPTLMFVGDQCGNAEDAIRFYTTIFEHSSVGDILRYGEDGAPNKPNMIQHVDFTLNNQLFSAMDSAYDHNFTFNEAISLVVKCETQAEIDCYWDKLSAVPEAEQCGWLKDKYGFSWQIVPSIMDEMMQNKDVKKLAQVTEAFLKMKKFEISELIEAYEK
ncbi:VOC family protein [Desulfosporosinus hippei]|uniref:Glyoxalase superfamily enzyme, possibly 3-demethylubiquinone-9 3-methyltransferase n=1 Tax=Desulfosporosinus hippei DSM 8344 TaxID=1121419 RepID=A0A1G7ZU25_9FIRM|nr:VOC family protein [Desulfosporosinus hippei]SDH12161.1 Glyoxalase superfamily enzyme, possibly 3-demethylubiquinone-9 3-methyltransferase [Desulfosporosinus hippei DSM 8344]